MIVQEIQVLRLLMVPQAVEFNAACIIDVKVLLLGYGVHLLIVEESHIADELLCLELANKILPLPVQEGDMPLASTQEHVPPVLGHIEGVRPVLIERQVEDVLGSLDRKDVLQLGLAYFEGPLTFFLYFEEAAFLCVEDLCLLFEASLCLFLEHVVLVKECDELLVFSHYRY